MIMAPRLTLSDAKTVVQGAEAKAAEIGVDMDIAVVDDGGHLLAFVRMDQARVTSIDVAINKAFTAACARKATHEYAKVAGAGGPAFGIQSSNQGRFMIVGGGLPIFIKGTHRGWGRLQLRISRAGSRGRPGRHRSVDDHAGRAVRPAHYDKNHPPTPGKQRPNTNPACHRLINHS